MKCAIPGVGVRMSDMPLDRARLQMQMECIRNRENIRISSRARAKRRERCAFFQYAEEPAPGSLLSLMPSGSTVHNTCHDCTLTAPWITSSSVPDRPRGAL